jgi:hypothetical protein
MKLIVQRCRYLLLAAAVLLGIWLSAASAGPSLASPGSVNPSDAISTWLQPVVPPTPPEQSARALTLAASATDIQAGQRASLTARANRPLDGAYAIVIRREGGHLGSGIEATCWSQPDCTAETRGNGVASARFAAALYRCDSRGFCILEEDADDADKVRVNWR